MTKISVIIPVYNVEKTIARCATSLFKQTYDDWEGIFVDDGAVDNSISVLKQTIEAQPNIKNKIRIIHHARNLGLSAARNTGVRAANGMFIYHMDSDDYIEPWTLEAMITKAEEEKADIVIGGNLDIYQDGRVGYECPVDYAPLDKSNYLKKLLVREGNYSIFNKLIKRDLIIKYGLFSVEGISMCEDYVLYPRIVYYATKITSLNKEQYYSYNYVTNFQSITHVYKFKNLEDSIEAQNILNDFFIKNNDYTPKRVIELSTLITKFNLFKISKIADYPKIQSYANHITDFTGLSIKSKLILILAKHKCFLFINFILFVNRLINRILHHNY